MELRLAVAKFYQTFTNGVRMASTHGMKDEDMEMLQFFIIAPKGHRCLLEVASRA